MLGKAREAMKTVALHHVLNAVWAVVAEANRYFAGEAPWALAKTDPARQKTVLYVTAEVIRQVAVLAVQCLGGHVGGHRLPVPRECQCGHRFPGSLQRRAQAFGECPLAGAVDPLNSNQHGASLVAPC